MCFTYFTISVIVIGCRMFISRVETKSSGTNAGWTGEISTPLLQASRRNTRCLKANYNPAIFTAHWPKDGILKRFLPCCSSWQLIWTQSKQSCLKSKVVLAACRYVPYVPLWFWGWGRLNGLSRTLSIITTGIWILVFKQVANWLMYFPLEKSTEIQSRKGGQRKGLWVFEECFKGTSDVCRSMPPNCSVHLKGQTGCGCLQEGRVGIDVNSYTAPCWQYINIHDGAQMRRLNRLSAHRKWLAGCEDYTGNKQEGHLDSMCCCACTMSVPVFSSFLLSSVCAHANWWACWKYSFKDIG